MMKLEGESKRVRRDSNHGDVLEQLLTIADVMGLLKVSRPKIYDLLEEGLPAIKFGRAVRFQPATLRRWLANRERIGRLLCHENMVRDQSSYVKMAGLLFR